MREEEEFFLVFGYIGVAHGGAYIGTGCANLLEMDVWFWHSVARPCHCMHGSCQGSGRPRLNFFRFFESYLDNYLQNNLKQQKKQTK